VVPVVQELGQHGIGFSETVLVTESGSEILSDVDLALAVR
jgi:Xaa-Pro aminopeptidase